MLKKVITILTTVFILYTVVMLYNVGVWSDSKGYVAVNVTNYNSGVFPLTTWSYEYDGVEYSGTNLGFYLPARDVVYCDPDNPADSFPIEWQDNLNIVALCFVLIGSCAILVLFTIYALDYRF